MPLLEVRDLRTHFSTPAGTVRAVDGMTFQVDKGETLGIVGESGSGKSVTSLSIMRLIQKSQGSIVGGEIEFDGTNLLELSESAMRAVRGRRIAMIFQDPMTSLNPVLTIKKQLQDPLRTHLNLSAAASYDRALELLDLVGIPSPRKRLEDYPHQLSGGMRQRVMIAIALSCGPELLIADEPTTALDVTIQAQILELIKDLQNKLGMAMLLITHDLGVVAGVADRVQVVYAGRIVEQAPVAELFENPRMPYTMGLLRSVPQINHKRNRLTAIPGRPPALTSKTVSCRFAPRCRFVQERCHTSVPELRSVRRDHNAACHFDIVPDWHQGEHHRAITEEKV